MFTNIVNGKSYIGTTINDVDKRFYRHKWDAISRNSQAPFHAAIRKHGVDSWNKTILYCSNDETDVSVAEEELIFDYNTFNNGYNGNATGKSASKSLPLIGTRNHMFNIGIDHPLYGVPRSTQTKAKIKENHQDVSGVKNSRAKRFVLLDPNGVYHTIDGNLQLFCNTHGLCRASIVTVSQGKQKHHKKWTAVCYGRIKDINNGNIK
jgi:group I intron endonuclease